MPELALIPTPANTGDERQLPRNIEAEAAFLGAILIDNRVVEDLPVALNPEHFFEPLHGRIFQQTMALIERNSIATPVTLKPYFEADEAMKAVGGVGYLAQLTGSGAGLSPSKAVNVESIRHHVVDVDRRHLDARQGVLGVRLAGANAITECGHATPPYAVPLEPKAARKFETPKL